MSASLRRSLLEDVRNAHARYLNELASEWGPDGFLVREARADINRAVNRLERECGVRWNRGESLRALADFGSMAEHLQGR